MCWWLVVWGQADVPETVVEALPCIIAAALLSVEHKADGKRHCERGAGSHVVGCNRYQVCTACLQCKRLLQPQGYSGTR